MPQREDEPGTSWMGEQFRVYFLIFVDFFFKMCKRCNVLCGSYEYRVFIPGVKQTADKSRFYYLAI